MGQKRVCRYDKVVASYGTFGAVDSEDCLFGLSEIKRGASRATVRIRHH